MSWHETGVYITGPLWGIHWFPSRKASNAELRWFLSCWLEHTFEQAVDLPVI